MPMSQIQLEKIGYKGWPNCYRLANRAVDLVVTTDVGPRIIRFGFTGEANEFKEYEPQMGRTGGKRWRIYGGHRLWVAPEKKPYPPDNSPVALEPHDGFIRLVQPPEEETGIQKEIDVHLAPRAGRAQVVHRLRNTTAAPVTLAPWALSVMAQGGKAIVPLRPRGAHENNLLPTDTLALWAYTDMADPRWTWGSRMVMLRQDPRIARSQKMGIGVPAGWAAYARGGHLFVKTFPYFEGAPYPDLGSSVELFTNNEILEVETLGPLVDLQPGATVEHVERWFLFRGVPVPKDEADVDEHLLPALRAARA